MSRFKKKNGVQTPCCEKDHPRVGDRVAVIREEHGWHDGRMGGIVKSLTHSKTQNGTRVSYVVTVIDDGYGLGGGYDVYCQKTRDCIKCG